MASYLRGYGMLSSWDIAVCLHFTAKLKMAARGPKRVAGEVFCCFLLGKVVLSYKDSFRAKILKDDCTLNISKAFLKMALGMSICKLECFANFFNW